MPTEHNTQWDFDFFGAALAATTTTYSISNTDGLTSLVISGTGFTYDSNGLPTGGTITSVSLVVNDGGGALVTMADLHVTLADYGNLLRAITAVDTAVTWDIGQASAGTISSTLIRVNNGDGSFTDIHGSGLSAPGGDIFGGTVTSIAHVAANGTTIIDNVTGLSTSLQSVAAALFNQTDSQMMILLNTGDNTITSPSGSILAHDIIYYVAFEDGPGNDTYNGQPGVNGVDMGYNSGPVVANLATGVATVGADTNTLTNIVGMNGTDFNDQITGSSANNNLAGWDGNDTLSGANGDDVLSGGLGNDTIDGGAGNDTASYSWGDSGDTAVTVSLAIATAQNTGGSGTDTLTGIENLIGTDFNDTLTGNSGVNVLTGMGGNDTLNGGAGVDIMIGGAGNDTYVVDNAGDGVAEDLNAGTDTVQSSLNYTLGANLENLIITGAATFAGGNELANVLTGNALANTLSGGAGNDTLIGGAGADQLKGGDGVDIASYANAAAGVTANLFDHTLNSGDAAGDIFSSIEVLVGSAFNDTLTGTSAANRLDGGAGADTMIGGAGADTYTVDNVGDVVSETLSASGGVDKVVSSISYTLGANLENLTLTGSAAINGTGNSLANTIYGNSAANTLNGGTGDDTLLGNAGHDILKGGAGADHFVFSSLNAADSDTISDFSHADDTIDLDNAIFTALGADGALAATAFWSSATGVAHDADDRVIYNSVTGQLYYDADGNGAGAAVLIATLTAHPTLDATDFGII